MVFVRDAKYLDAYQILVTFSDGVIKMVDLEAALNGPVFQMLRDLELFRSFRVDAESDTLVWPNGLDIAPEYLYENGTAWRKSQNP